MKKHRWCAWDLNQGLIDGRRRRIDLALAAPKGFVFFAHVCTPS